MFSLRTINKLIADHCKLYTPNSLSAMTSFSTTTALLNFAKMSKLDATSTPNNLRLRINETDALEEQPFVEYERNGNVFNLTHSYVPQKYRGQGVGEVLAEKVFDYIVENDYKMTITCDYLKRAYEKKRKQYESSVAS